MAIKRRRQLTDNAISTYREARKKQAQIISEAIQNAKLSDPYLDLEMEKKMAFARMAFTVAIPAVGIAILLTVIYVATW